MKNFWARLARFTPWGLLRRLRRAGFWFDPRDVPLFFLGAETDDRVKKLREAGTDRAAFETLYREDADPWASVTERFGYQSRKYDVVVNLLPKERRFSAALDLGCGLGTLSRRLVAHADRVLGLDVAQAAIDRASAAYRDVPGLSFAQGDVRDLSASLDGLFDLVLIADTIYYLAPITDEELEALAARIARLLAPGGLCVLVNHYFFARDAESALSRRIHDSFGRTLGLSHRVTHWRPFYLTSFLDKVPAASPVS